MRRAYHYERIEREPDDVPTGSGYLGDELNAPEFLFS
jgi:hypothetical protein